MGNRSKQRWEQWRDMKNRCLPYRDWHVYLDVMLIAMSAYLVHWVIQ